jgi:uncharacterized protein YfbU (UPF0304 family)
MTTLQELIKEFEDIKQTKCKTLQEVMFFDGVLAIIEGKYIEKEKEQIIQAFLKGKFEGGSRFDDASKEYYEKLFFEDGQ